MKILHINTNDSGGAAIAAIRLHILLLKNGYNSKILFLKRSSKSQIPESYYYEDRFKYSFFFKIVEKLNSFYNRKFTFFKPKIYFNGPQSIFKVENHPLFKNAEIVHLHWVVKFIDWNRLFKNTSKKYIWTFHDLNPFTGGEHYKTGYNDEFKSIGLKNILVKTSIIKKVNIKIICPSIWMKNLSLESSVFREKETVCIRNYVDSLVFNIKKVDNIRSKYNIEKEKKIILFVAENPLDSRKGFKIMCEALNKIKDVNNIHLLILGNSISNFDIQINYTFLGKIEFEDKLSEIYNLADIFIIPSIEDNLPNTVTESLLCGTPVVGFKIGGIQEMIKDGINGFLSENFNNLGKTIEKSLEVSFNDEEVRKTALDEVNKQKILTQIITLYN